MTTKISPQKLSRLLSLYFEGYTQVQIAQKLDIDQSTVSLYISEFSAQSQAKGLMAASQEVGIMNTVSALHSLAVELHTSKLSVEEAKIGLKTRLKLGHSGLEPLMGKHTYQCSCTGSEIGSISQEPILRNNLTS